MAASVVCPTCGFKMESKSINDARSALCTNCKSAIPASVKFDETQRTSGLFLFLDKPNRVVLASTITIAVAFGAATGSVLCHALTKGRYLKTISQINEKLSASHSLVQEQDLTIRKMNSEIEASNAQITALTKDRDRWEAVAKRPKIIEKPITPPTEFRELTPSYKIGRKWRAVVVPKGLSKEKLIELARYLHKDDDTSSVRFFDDDKLYEEFRRHDENYPNKQFPSPETWVSQHYLALLNKVGGLGGGRWELWAMDGGLDYLPNNANSQSIAIID